MLNTKSLVVRPPFGPEEAKPPERVGLVEFVTITNVFCKNSKSKYASPLTLNRSPEHTIHLCPFVGQVVKWIVTLLMSVFCGVTAACFQLQVFVGLSLNLPPVNPISEELS